jgi:hypothetical protein
MPEEAWVSLLGSDPRSWLRSAPEPSARWLTLTALLDLPADDLEVEAARRDVLADAGTEELVGRLGDWEVERHVSGHDSPSWAPNLLLLLADIGVRAGDDERIEVVLDAMLRHQDRDGRFESCGRSPATPELAWAALLCDTHAITDSLIRFGKGGDSRVAASVERMAADCAGTSLGAAWPCLPAAGFRGPGRRGDPCPMVTLEALRVFGRLPAHRRPAVALEAVRTLLRIWRDRGATRPYVFGHGRSFKTAKWPATWYSVLAVLDAIAGHPQAWHGPAADPGDRRAAAELVACLAAYNLGSDGRVTPQSCFKGFESFSFGQKREPSAWATARVCAVLRRFDILADDVRTIDVRSLGSSKGGTGTAKPPRVTSRT